MIKFFSFLSRKTKAVSPDADLLDGSNNRIQINPDGKRVLIVDDDPVFLKATALKLQSAGCRVRTAREASEAIAALSEQPVDAILIDICFETDVANGGMASWDGFQTMSWLRSNPGAKGARFIMVSNSDSASYRQRARQLGAVAFFQKPLNHERLFAEIDPPNTANPTPVHETTPLGR